LRLTGECRNIFAHLRQRAASSPGSSPSRRPRRLCPPPLPCP
jgi:hypothetical protein